MCFANGLVNENPSLIAAINNPTEKVQLIALEKNVPIERFKVISNSTAQALAKKKTLSEFTQPELKILYKGLGCGNTFTLNESCSNLIYFYGKKELDKYDPKYGYMYGYAQNQRVDIKNPLEVGAYCDTKKKFVYSYFSNSGAQHEDLFYRGCMSILSR